MITSRRVRGTHSTQCKNRNPHYQVPENHRKRLAFIRDLVDASQSRDVTRSDEAMLSRHQGDRQKHFYRDRANAINALHSVFSEHVNLVTFQVEISLRNASDAAGLSTVSDAEQQRAKEDPTHTPVVSISRASRAFKDMVALGWIRADKDWQVWDKEAGCWIDKYFEVTDLFFNACGITTERVLRQQAMRMGYLKEQALKNGKTPEQVGRMSLTQIKADRKLQWRRNAFERRGKEHARKKALRALHDKDRAEQRRVAQDRVLAALSPFEMQTISQLQFKELVNKEIAMLRKFAGISPPVH
ncbi:hypothetical protein DXJ78_24135 [Vibrio parahaemolyticus]|nr:hypothetical protein DXJ78_24135 [Vibrio parahaemolyticus]